jgi:hypothetical protein
MEKRLLPEPERILTKDDEEIRIAASEFKGRNYINFRLWIQKCHGEWIPTKQGVTFSIDNLPEVAKAFADLNRLFWPE